MALGADQSIKVKLLTKQSPCLSLPRTGFVVPHHCHTQFSHTFLHVCWSFTDLLTTKWEDLLVIFLTDDFELNVSLSKKTQHWFQSLGMYQIGFLSHHFASVSKDSLCI